MSHGLPRVPTPGEESGRYAGSSPAPPPAPTAPLDALHDECVQARAEIRAEFHRLQAWAQVWEPRPWPPGE